MTQARVATLVLVLSLGVSACRRPPPDPPAPLLPQVSGTLLIPGLTMPVRVVRDAWGVPHLYANSQADLFFAQGFVQAQDRLFQMDLWRRSAQGRLSEVLGANFIERDAMTRRMQYHGDMRAEWDSYGSDTEAIATAFVHGVNAWIDTTIAHLPEEFALAGWRPEHWKPEDLLNRTDAFVASANAGDEVFDARLVAALGARRAESLIQGASPVHLDIPAGLDVNAISYIVGDALREVGARPFFSTLAAPVRTARRNEGISPVAGWEEPKGADGRVGSNAWAVSASRSVTGAPLLAADPHRPLDHPSWRYLVHLNAPGWNVIGAASPWLPGIVIGHNQHLAWAMTSRAEDVQDLYAEKVNPTNPHQIEQAGRWTDTRIIADPIVVKRREKPFPFDLESTSHGVIIASDRARHLAFTVRWTGFEPGTAAELGALALNRAASADEFRRALGHWKLPTATFVFATDEGGIGTQAAGLLPIRRAWSGSLPVPGWTGAYEWQGVSSASAGPDRHGRDYVVSANDDIARTRRIDAVLSSPSSFGLDDFRRLQHDTLAWNAEQLVPLLAPLRSDRADVDNARARLLAWDRRIAADSVEATLYVLWERAMLRRLAQGKLDSSLVDDFLAHEKAVLVPAITRPSSVWFTGSAIRARDVLILAALVDAVDAARAGPADRVQPWGALHSALFRHPLAIGAAARARYNVGPFQRAGYAETVMAADGADFEQRSGASFRMIVDVADWDRSVATNAPGQSGAPASRHFADLARLWAAGEYFPLWFSERAVQDHAETTLTLAPPPADRARACARDC
jgi:penicillin amidase